MISQTNSSVLHAAYPKKTQVAKPSSSVVAQDDKGKLEELKESLDSGKYKVNVQALSEKIADSLL